MLDLRQDTPDDETYLRICRETGRISDLIERLLTLGRIDEAAEETEEINDPSLPGLADLFLHHGQDTVAERLVRGRLKEKPEWRILEWLQKYYQARGNASVELEIVEMVFCLQPYLRSYQELRTLTQQLHRWETLQPEIFAFLEQTGKKTLLIQIALDEGDIDNALQRLKGMAKQDRHGHIYSGSSASYGRGSIALTVAKEAEETLPREAIELYRQHAERLVALRGCQNYQDACEYFAKMRTLYERLGEMEIWTGYITALREQNRALRALKEELVRAIMSNEQMQRHFKEIVPINCPFDASIIQLFNQTESQRDHL